MNDIDTIISRHSRPGCHIRWMIRRDMVEVLAIEQESFEAPWPEERFLECLKQRDCIGMVAERGEKVVGYMIYQLHKNKLELLRFAVGEAWRRQGVGAAMMEKLKSKLSSHRRTRIGCDVSEWFTTAHMFLRAVGWRASRVDRRAGEADEDTYRFATSIAAEAEASVSVA